MRKLLDKQKEGKKKMRRYGELDIPQEAFIAALKVDVRNFSGEPLTSVLRSIHGNAC